MPSDSEKGRQGLPLKKLTATLAFACGLVLAAPAAAVEFGANDDTGKYAEDGGAVFFPQLAAAGLKQNVVTVRWTPGETEPAEAALLDVTVPLAVEHGIRVVFAVYPYPPSALEAGLGTPAAFADWLRALAERYPRVRTYVVGNEPNLNTFWRPQGDAGGRVFSGATFGPYLAAGYDALKAVSPEMKVLGIGLSPRGGRAPGYAGKSSPLHFLKSLGDWYRTSRRPAPLMDGFSYHPYPSPSDFTVPFTFTYSWPNAGLHELARVKQALWDAFNGTPQRTTLQGLKLHLDEVGWQVDTTGREGYTGWENVRVATETAQAGIYDQLVRFVGCDPDVAELNFFGYYDERDRGGWQSALRRVDGTERPAHAAVAAAIAQTGGSCQGPLRQWRPQRRPDGVAVSFTPVSAVKARTGRWFGFTVTANEDVTVRVGLVPAGTPVGRIPARLNGSRSVLAHRRPLQNLWAKPTAGRKVLAVYVSAKLNPARTALFRSRPFAVGAAVQRPSLVPGVRAG